MMTLQDTGDDSSEDEGDGATEEEDGEPEE